tara:strand:+ start:941 stop:1468 length:528 start_codon:yes stop_codon:yes gene_type:complete
MNKEQIKKYIDNELVKILCQHELAIYQARQTRMDTKVQRYFNSTPLRNVFCRMIVYARCVNQHYNIQYIADQLNTTRQSISKIVDECEAERWINVIRTPNNVVVQANDVTYEGMLDYLEKRKKILPKQMRRTWNELLYLENLVTTELTLDDESSDNPSDVDQSDENVKVIGKGML